METNEKLLIRDQRTKKLAISGHRAAFNNKKKTYPISSYKRIVEKKSEENTSKNKRIKMQHIQKLAIKQH